jgi:linoleoyl-CoA desaturase
VVTGVVLGVVFQLAHVVEGVTQPEVAETGFVEENFAVHQMRTTSDFGRSNPLLRWYVGGLNFQVEHHLFPKICSIHYWKISPIVERVAQRHGVPFNEHRTFRQAVASHYKALRELGRGTYLAKG